MKRISFRDILLLSMSAVLLNISFAVAQPTQPPANGVLTPNFSGLNVSGNTSIGGTLQIDTIEHSAAGDVIFNDDIFAEQNIIVSDNTTTTGLITNTISSNGALVSFLKPIEVGQLEADTIISKDDGGAPVRVNDDLYVRDRLEVDDMSYLSDLDVSGDAQIDGELNATMGIVSGQADLGSLMTSSITRSGNANNEVVFNSPVNISNRIEIDNTNLLTYLKNRISFEQGGFSNSQSTYASCGIGRIAISCGSNTGSWHSRLVEVYRTNQNTCVAKWASADYSQSATAICFDY